MKTAAKWLAAAALLIVTAGGVQAQDVELPDQGTTEISLAGNISFESDSSWQVDGMWAPFVNPNLQWGIKARIFDTGAPGSETSGILGVLANWHFVPTSGATVPYVGAFIGFGFGSNDDTFWDIHAGIKHFLTSQVAFFAELQMVDGGTFDNDLQLIFGLSIFRR